MKTHAKHTLTGLLLGGILAISAAQAQNTLTVDNRPGAVAMFTNFPAAYAAANDGDTILLAGSSNTYTGATIYKQLTIIGSGYFHRENGIPGTNPNVVGLSLTLANDSLIGSASGTKLIGLSGGITVHSNVTGVVIDKCSNGLSNWVFNSPVSVSRCYVRDGYSLGFSSGSSGSIVRNSIVSNLNFGTVGINAERLVITNSFNGRASTSISNSIFVFSNAGSFNRNDSSVSHCMAVGFSTLPAGGGNINGQLINDVFLNAGSNDAKWQLKGGSPALGAGTGGSDMGAFGGASPYVLSGLPGIPRITRLVVPATATSTSGLQVEVDAQAFPE